VIVVFAALLSAPAAGVASGSDSIALTANPDPTAIFEPTTVTATGTATEMAYIELAEQAAGNCPATAPDSTFDDLSVNPGPYSVTSTTTLPGGQQAICAWGFDANGNIVASASLPIYVGADAGSVAISAPAAVSAKQALAVTVAWHSNFAGYVFLDSRLSARGQCASAPGAEPSSNGAPEIYFLSGNGNLNPSDANAQFFSPWDPIASPGGQITYTSSRFDAAQILAGGSTGGNGTYRLCAWLSNATDGNTNFPVSSADVVAGPITATVTLTGAGPGLLFPRLYGSWRWHYTGAGVLSLTVSVSGDATIVGKLYHASNGRDRLLGHILTETWRGHRGVNHLTVHGFRLIAVGRRYAVVLSTRVGQISAPGLTIFIARM
jgi:hypothetical protein